ncbi:CoA-disulfide reductase [Bacillus aerolatus]|uniref:CoA-disulfide reductase n=1 Tax=Bacillus aerolatus TaxID=2653354 RepID=A0A6I1FUF7_9BACI|nr:CoA-disulfide reductase [Bacillus aerolatus]KAB7706203.1 CoA-disulfide reductase [Bacillus aerolatus]
MKYVIIGGDAAGMSAAMQIIRKDKQADVTVLEKGGIYSYGQCGLPYVVGGVIESTDRLIARTVDTFRHKYNIDAKVYCEVKQVDVKKKTVSGMNTLTNEPFTFSYDRLLVASGASPNVPSWKGATTENVHLLKTIPDAERILASLDEKVKDVTIIGGGYIGLEAAENFKRTGRHVRIIQRSEHVAGMLDEEMAMYIHEEAEKQGIELILKENVIEIIGKDKAEKVITDKHEYKTDFILVSVGIRPNTGFLMDTGVKMLKNGAVIVNEFLESFIPDLYAAGDCATHYHLVKKEPAYIPLGTTANKQGRIAGMNMSGSRRAFKGVTGTSVLKFMDLSIATTGLSEKEAKTLQLPYDCVHTTTKNKSGYYPDAAPLHLKIVYRKDNGLLLGGQILGIEGADKRIDVLSTAIFNEMTIADLEDLDLCYSPPFNSVWDPLQQAARRAK